MELLHGPSLPLHLAAIVVAAAVGERGNVLECNTTINWGRGIVIVSVLSFQERLRCSQGFWGGVCGDSAHDIGY